MPNVTFARATLPVGFGGAICARWPNGDAVVVIDTGLGRRERHEALAHELVHIERTPVGIGEHPMLEQLDEERVRREVASRCVPLGALASYVRRRVESDFPVTAADVSEEFDVTEELAALALRLLPAL